MGFDRWTFSPGYDRPARTYTSDQGPGTTHHKIPSVTARRGRFPPPCDGGGDVGEGGHTTEPRAGCLHPPPHFRTCRRAQLKTWWHSYPPKLHPSRLTLAPLTGRSTPLTFAGRGLTDGHFHLGVIAKHIGTLRIKVRAQPTARFPPLLPDVAVPLLRATAPATSVRGSHHEALCQGLAPATALPDV